MAHRAACRTGFWFHLVSQTDQHLGLCPWLRTSNMAHGSSKRGFVFPHWCETMEYPGALWSHPYNTQKAGWRQDQRSQWCKEPMMRISELILEVTGWSKDWPLCGNFVSLFLFRSAQAVILRKEISGFSNSTSQIHTSLMKITFSSGFKIFSLYVLCPLLRSHVYMCVHFCVVEEVNDWREHVAEGYYCTSFVSFVFANRALEWIW